MADTKISELELVTVLDGDEHVAVVQDGDTKRATINQVRAALIITVGPSGSGASYITDGTADDVQIQDAINAAAVLANGPVIVRLLPGTYSIDTGIDLLSNVTLEGSGVDSTTISISSSFASASETWAVGAAGSVTTGTSIPLGANATYGATQLTATAGTEFDAINAGDYLALISDKLWEATNQSNREVGEFVRVYSKSSPTLNLYGMVRDTYETVDTARLYRVSFVENCGIKNLTIKQAGALGSSAGNHPPLVAFQLCRGAFVVNCRLHNNDGPGVGDMHSIATLIANNRIHDLTDNTSANHYGYGTIVGTCSEGTVIVGNRYANCRHAVDAGPHRSASGFTEIANNGIPRGVVVIGNTATRIGNTAYTTHSEAEGWLFQGNTAENCESAGIYMRGRDMAVIGNTVQWCSGGIQIGNNGAFGVSTGTGAGSHVVGNTVRHIKSITPRSTGTNFSGYGIITALTDNIVVSGNTIGPCDAAGIRVRAMTRRSVFKNNTIINANTLNTANMPAIEVEGNSNGAAAALSYSAGVVTVTGMTSQVNSNTGATIVISGSSTSANNGEFTITEVVSSTSVKFENASGATDAGPVSYYIVSSTDNVIEGNTAINTAASTWQRDATGHAKYLVRDNGTNGNRNNIVANNTGIGMETDLLSLNNPYQTCFGNRDGNGRTYEQTKYWGQIDYPLTSYLTTGTSAETIFTLTTASGRTYSIKGVVTVQNSTASVSDEFTVEAFYRRVGSTTTLVDQTVTAKDGASGVTVAFDTSGTSPIITVAGVASVRVNGRLFIQEGKFS